MSYFAVDLKTKNKELQTDVMVCKNSPSLTSNMTSNQLNNFISKSNSLESEIRNLKNKKSSICSCNSKNNETTNRFRSCLDLLNNGFNKSGKYDIKPYLNITRTVYCDQDTEGGGWTVFLRNSHGLVTFNKRWAEYKNGFGNVEYDFWLGNEFLYNVTKLYNSHISKTVELYVIVAATDDLSSYAMYKNFAVLSEATSYKLQVSHHFKGTMGDALESHNNMKFSTKDRDNDQFAGDCADANGGYGWWYDKCYDTLLTGMKYDAVHSRYKPAPQWYFIFRAYRFLKNATMMFREKENFRIFD